MLLSPACQEIERGKNQKQQQMLFGTEGDSHTTAVAKKTERQISMTEISCVFFVQFSDGFVAVGGLKALGYIQVNQ